MLSLSSSPSIAPQPAAYPQVGQIPVGQESAQQRLQRIRPVEQTPAVARGDEEKRQLSPAGKGGKPVDATADQDKRKQARDAAQEKLAQAELAQLKQLAARDREVRAHEQAHKAVAGSYGGAIHYEYQRGPDGNRYAVGGEVSIDTAPESSPEATLAKARVIQRAASAPAEPSDQDRAVAAQAAQMEQQALQQLAQQRQEARTPDGKPNAEGDNQANVGPVTPANGRADSGADKTASNLRSEKEGSVGVGPQLSSDSSAHKPVSQEPAVHKKAGKYGQDGAASLHFHVQA